MTPDQAADLAARTLAAIPTGDMYDPCRPAYAADRGRVASDLAGVQACAQRLDDPLVLVCRARFIDGLRRTAALYGVEFTASDD